ncbi:MAG TPA: biopolymer transporter ExbD [Nitrospiria bacterium]|jgi:biopolymer transport protein TolR|nr:biopolymer transporter ExbD [Nitrospiria bacterium]
MTNGTQGRRLMSEINVVPLVDVVLVLLVIFMVTAPLLYRGLDIDLPRTATNTIAPEERVVLTVNKQREIFLDKDAVSLDRLLGALETLKGRSPQVSIYLRADRQVPYGVVVQVMDTVKRAGIERLGMVTEPAAETRRDGQR